MKRKALIVLCLGAAAMTAPGHADTLYLQGGITVDGVVKVRPDGVYEVNTAGRTVFYRPEEVERHETNDKTGHLDMDAVKAGVQARLAELERETGLTAEQRARVNDFLNRLESGTASTRLDARDRLVAMNQEISIVRYLKTLFDQLITPSLLEAIYYVSPSECVPELERGVMHSNYLCRAKAIDLLALMVHRPSAPLVARGLADHKLEVKLSAAYALAKLGERAASPALVELKGQPDVKLANASQEALQALWASELPQGGAVPKTVSEWNAFLEGRSIDGAFGLASLEPLIMPEEEFIIG
jgi:hypothetical protein